MKKKNSARPGTFARVMGYIGHTKGVLALSLLFSLLVVVCSLGIPYCIGLAIDAVAKSAPDWDGVLFYLCLALILTALIALIRYVRRGKLYIFGGFLIALGAYTVLIDLLLRVTFSMGNVILWSIFSAATGFMLGMMLIVIAIVKPLRESLRKRFFLG